MFRDRNEYGCGAAAEPLRILAALLQREAEKQEALFVSDYDGASSSRAVLADRLSLTGKKLASHLGKIHTEILLLTPTGGPPIRQLEETLDAASQASAAYRASAAEQDPHPSVLSRISGAHLSGYLAGVRDATSKLVSKP